MGDGLGRREELRPHVGDRDVVLREVRDLPDQLHVGGVGDELAAEIHPYPLRPVLDADTRPRASAMRVPNAGASGIAFRGSAEESPDLVEIDLAGELDVAVAQAHGAVGAVQEVELVGGDHDARARRRRSRPAAR